MEKCNHCQLSFNENELITDEFGNKFCCNGCKEVFYLLNNEGYAEFYEKLGKNKLDPVSSLKKFTKENTENFYKNYVKKTDDGFNEIYIIIEGIHCAACVWLNEKVLFNHPGIIEASINASTHKAKIIWDENTTNLANIFNLINSIGYNAFAYDPKRSQKRMDAKRREYYSKLLVGIFVTMNIMWIAVALYSGYFSSISQANKDLLHFVEFILATPVIFYTGSVFFKGAKTSIKTRVPNMDLLVITGALTAYFYSVYVMLTRSGEVYFESAAMIITFVFGGKYLELLAQKKAVDRLDSFSNLLNSEVMVKNGDNFEAKDLNLVKKGDIILINSGDKVLVDGKVISGSGSFDYASLSGESLPIFKEKNLSVDSGAICLDGSLTYEASCDFKSSLLNKIITLLENASFKKSKIELLTTKISGYFSAVILSLSLITFICWMIFNSDLQKSILVAVSVLIVACPCALGLATPVATLVGLSIGLKNKIIFKEAAILESVAGCENIVFDKTGTLTKGEFEVINFTKFKEFDGNLLLNLVKKSNHLVSKSIFKFINDKVKFNELKFSEFSEIAAKGVKARYKNFDLIGGNFKFLNECGIECKKSDLTNYFFAIDGEVVAKFELEDMLKDDAKIIIENIKNLGLKPYILSGDNEKVVENIAKKLGINDYKANFSPLQKADFVKNLKKVIMVGDGINDANALSIATVGIAMGNGASISVEKSDVVLMDDSLKSLYEMIIISKKTLKTIKENLAISFFYNAITIPLAVFGYIIPLIAALSMSLSSLAVVLNSVKNLKD